VRQWDWTTRLTLYRRLRAAKLATPVLVLSGLSQRDATIKRLGVGPEHYLVRSVDDRDLIARLQMLVRRQAQGGEAVVRAGDLAVDLSGGRVSVRGQPLHLTRTEYAILELLARHKETPVSKALLFRHLYGGTEAPKRKAIDVFVCQLRKKLRAVGAGAPLIETIRGRGYVLRDRPSGEPHARAAARG